MRSIDRDVKAMSQGLDAVNQEIDFWEQRKKKDKSMKHRLERLYEAKKHLMENPDKANELVQRL
jgi:hypothetical protein